MNMIRNIIAWLAIASLAAVSVVACSTTTDSSGKTTVTVSLAAVQAETAAVVTAINASAVTLAPSMIPADRAHLDQTLAALQAAANAIEGLPQTTSLTSAATYAQAVSQAVASALPFLPLPPATKLAVEAGMILVDGLTAGLTTVTVNVPPAKPSVAANETVLVAPIPIPVIVTAHR